MTGEQSAVGQGTVACEMARLSEAARAVQALWDDTPRVGLVLGTGLCGLADAIECDAEVPYGDLPHFPLPTVPTRQGGLICGALEDVPVVAMQGRLHRYEGYTLAQVAFPVRLMRLLGTEALIVTAACGAVNPLWALGDIVVLDDHINLMGDSPLIGPNLDEIGPRFPDMSAPYDPALQELRDEGGALPGDGAQARRLRCGRRTAARDPRRVPHAPPNGGRCGGDVDRSPRSSPPVTLACGCSLWPSSPTCASRTRWRRSTSRRSSPRRRPPSRRSGASCEACCANPPGRSRSLPCTTHPPPQLGAS